MGHGPAKVGVVYQVVVVVDYLCLQLVVFTVFVFFLYVN